MALKMVMLLALLVYSSFVAGFTKEAESGVDAWAVSIMDGVDSDKDHKVSEHELKHTLEIAGIDADHNGKISMKEILAHVVNADAIPAEKLKSWKQSFHETDADFDGYLSTAELKTFMNTVGMPDRKVGEAPGHSHEWQDWLNGFKAADNNNDMYLTVDELTTLLKSVSKGAGEQLFDKSFKTVMKGFDMDKNGKISWKEILHHVGEGTVNQLSEMFRSWNEGFHEADGDDDGYLTPDEFTFLLKHVSKEEAEEVFDPVDSLMRHFDTDGNRRLSMKEILAHLGDVEGLSAEKLKGWKQGYHDADADHDGYLTAPEFQHLLNNIGMPNATEL